MITAPLDSMPPGTDAALSYLRPETHAAPIVQRSACRSRRRPLLIALAIVAIATAGPGHGLAAAAAPPGAPPKVYYYNTDYLFAATRGLRDDCESPALVVILSPLTLAVDFALLPFATFLGFFG